MPDAFQLLEQGESGAIRQVDVEEDEIREIGALRNFGGVVGRLQIWTRMPARSR